MRPDFPNRKRSDSIICFYVLNVLLPEEQANCFDGAFILDKPTGKSLYRGTEGITAVNKVFRMPKFIKNRRINAT